MMKRRRMAVTAALIGTAFGAAGQGAFPGPARTATTAPPGLAPGPTLAVHRENGQVAIVFDGTLQAADSLAGPWADVPGAASPHLPEATGPRRFYRSRGPDGIFGSGSIATLSFEGPFQVHFELAHAGVPDGIFPPRREKPYFEGTLETGPWTLPARMRVRGNSSLQECPFPKLKFKVSAADRAGTPFFDAREIKLGTHCSDEGGRGPVGRLREEIATHREGLAYEAMQALGFRSPRVRRARVTFRDTSPVEGRETAGWQVTRQALLLDDIEVVAERLGGRALDDEEIAALSKADFDETVVTGLRFLHALLGNWDYALTLDGRGLWNTEVIRTANGRLEPVAGDFDLASWVTGILRPSFPWDYHPELPELERQARYELEQIQGRASKASFEAATERFRNHESALTTLVEQAEVDEAGRTNALRHLEAFYQALTTVVPSR